MLRMGFPITRYWQIAFLFLTTFTEIPLGSKAKGNIPYKQRPRNTYQTVHTAIASWYRNDKIAYSTAKPSYVLAKPLISICILMHVLQPNFRRFRPSEMLKMGFPITRYWQIAFLFFTSFTEIPLGSKANGNIPYKQRPHNKYQTVPTAIAPWYRNDKIAYSIA